jgi:GNAT superfamily N-acetyltransferase
VIAPRRTWGGDPALRDEVLAQDAEHVERIVRSTGAFREDEVAVALELVHRTVGYACYGPIACALHSWDLYWIAVDEPLRGLGIGRELLEATERAAAAAGARRLYVETSSKPAYAATRAFYEALGYVAEAVLTDFYAPDDSKVIFVKAIGPA